MGALGRVELPTNGLGNRCSIHLSYRALHVDYRMMMGADDASATNGASVHLIECVVYRGS